MRDTWMVRDERGFTLPEVLATLAILGVLVTIAVIVLLGILEQRRVDAATRQLATDMRLAHMSATNQLTDWRVIVVLDRGDESDGPDYFLVRLENPYESGSVPKIDRIEPRYFSGVVRTKNVKTASGFLVDKHGEKYWASPWEGSPPDGVQTKTFEFNSDATAKMYGGVSGSVCVTQDGDPQNRVTVLSATSRVRIESDSSCNTT